jgi:hypothetical protein
MNKLIGIFEEREGRIQVRKDARKEGRKKGRRKTGRRRMHGMKEGRNLDPRREDSRKEDLAKI